MPRAQILAILMSLATLGIALPSNAHAQEAEQRFHDLFVTAGYATAFGAALGTAVLGLTSDPADNLQYIAVGASLGFIGGSILGSYIIFTPMMGDATEPASSTLLSSTPIPDGKIMLRPTFERDTGRLSSVESGMTLFSF